MVAVIVTHHPDASVGAVISRALEEADQVVIVDNGSADATLAPVAAATAGGRVLLVRNAANLGVAAAQNQGIARAVAAGAAWVLLLDQDSLPEPGMVAALLAAATAGGGAPVGLAVPVPVNPGQVQPTPFVTSPDGRQRRVVVPVEPVLRHLLFGMASGSLIPVDVLARVGGMRDDFFIDYVDIEFGLRLRRAGYDVVCARDARLSHRLGAYAERRLLGRVVRVTHHSAERRYTLYRNRIRTMRLHGRAMPAFLRGELPSMAFDVVRLLLFETNRPAKLWASLSGAVAGLTGRL